MLVNFVVIHWKDSSVHHATFGTSLEMLRAAFGSNTPQFSPYEGGSGIHGLLCVNDTDHAAVRKICGEHGFIIKSDGKLQDVDDALYTAEHTPISSYRESAYRLEKY